VYPVSEAYQEAVQENTRKYHFSGIITTASGQQYPFQNKDIVKGSGYLTNQCCGDNEIEFGSVYAAELGISLYNPIDRYTLEGAELSLSFFLQLKDGSYEEVPMGVFDISEATRTVKCLTITAYDRMLRFEKSFSGKLTSGTAYQFLALACEECGMELAHTELEMESWPNAKEVLGVYAENDIETWRDVLYYIAQVLGRFCVIDRTGKLELRAYGIEPVRTIGARHRYSSSFSDFVTRYTAVSSTNKRTDTSEYYALDPDDGLTMNLGVNPLLQFGLESTREKLLTNILTVAGKINFIPFESETIGDPAFDLGDVIRFSGGHADEQQDTCITKFSYKINGKHTLKCVGKDPRLSTAKSKNDKNISGLLNQIEAGKIAVYTYLNAAPYSISSEETEICSIEFAANEDTDAEFHGSILLDVKANSVSRSAKTTVKIPVVSTNESVDAQEPTEKDEEIVLNWMEDGKAIITVTYILNDSTITTYTPVETLHSGQHILNLYYPLGGLKAASYNTFRVRMKIADGFASIEPSQEICTISGQGLSANSAWDGRMEFMDEFPAYPMGASIALVSVDDYVSTYTEQPKPAFYSDRYPLLNLGGGMILCGVEAEANANEVVTQQTASFIDTSYTEVVRERHRLKREFTYRGMEISGFAEGRLESLLVRTSDKTTVNEIEVTSDGGL